MVAIIPHPNKIGKVFFACFVYNTTMNAPETAQRTSVGVFIRNAQGFWLLGHATGQRHWDIFKGMPDPNEIPEQTALRELREETGLTISQSLLFDTGIHAYRPDKKLHIFTAHVDVDCSTLKCTSFFEHPKTHQTIPEMDAFAWYSPEQAKDKAVPRLWSILSMLAAQPAPSPSF